MNAIRASTLVATWTVRALADRPASPAEPPSAPCPGAVLLIDLVGFTPTAVTLVQRHGRDAGFALSRVLDETLGGFVDAISAHGGEVSSFAGDALMAFWPAAPPEVTEDLCVRRACACAEALLAVARDRSGSAVTAVEARVGVAAGPCSVAGLGGGAGRALFTLAGAAVREAIQAAGAAGTGEIVLGPAAVGRVAGVAGARLGEARAGGCRRLESLTDAVPLPAEPAAPDEGLDALARPYLHPALAARVDAGFGDLMSEMRVATVLFARVGAHDDAPGSLAALDAVVRDLDEVVTRWGGVLDSVEIGDKGTVLVAVFGVFMGGREVGPPQALRCALEIAARDPAWGVGVATGRLFCGIIGGRARKTWVQVGTTMSLAARLMQVGAGVHCDGPTADAGDAAVDLDAPVERALKGFGEPVRTHLARAPRSSYASAPAGPPADLAVAGRAAEARHIDAALDDARAGRNRVLAAVGEAGIGKSTLAAFALRALGLDPLVLAFRPELVAGAMISPHTPFEPPARWEVDQLRIHASYYFFVAALTWQVMNDVSPWLWRAVARVFVAWSALSLFAYAVTFNLITYSWHVLLFNSLQLAVLLGNLWLLRHGVAVEDLGVARATLGLGQGDLVAAAPMALQTAAKRRRASHLYGVGAEGVLAVTAPGLGDPSFPHNDYFHRIRGRRGGEPVTMRFANLSHEDDAALDVRGAALRVGDEGDPERLELVFNTGSYSPPRNLMEFAKFVVSKWAPKFVARRALERDPIAFEGAVAGLRRAPDSYAGLRYYSQIVRIWVGVRGAKEGSPAGALVGERRMNLVRYRLVPVVPGEEPGLPDQTDTAAVWERGRRPSETRAHDYLRRAFKETLARGDEVRFALQAQFREVDEPAGRTGEALSWYNAGVDWDEDLCPWRDLGLIELTRALDDARTERLRFNPGQHPLGSMGVPASPGPRDYRSLGDAEVRVMRLLGELRALSQRWGRPS